MKIPFKISLLLWLINRDRNFQLHRFSPTKARAINGSKGKSIERFMDEPAMDMHSVVDREIPGRDGPIPIRIYQSVKGENLPVIMYYHGGGFVISSIETHDKICRRLARDSEAIVISVEYRLAPEHKYPAAVHDCYDATTWASEHASELHGDPTKLVVMGDSAGGNLAAVVSMMARDLRGPKIAQQVLIYPVTDGTMSSPSIDKNGMGYLLTKDLMKWFVNHYKRSDKDLHEPYFSPLLAKDLSNLPPAYVMTAEYDPLLDEGKLYADRLKEAGNKVVYKNYEGMIHAFISMPKMSKIIIEAYDDIKNEINKVLEIEVTA